MSQLARCFGDPENLDFDHLSENTQVTVTEDSIKDKLEDKEEMKKTAEALIRLENYEGAQKIWDHIDIVDKVIQAGEDKKKAASEEQYELAMKLRDDINNYKEQLMDAVQISDLFNSESTRHNLTMKNLLNQVLYRVEDSFAQYYIPKFTQKYQSIDERDFDSKVCLKNEAMIEALILLKISKIGLDEYKLN